MSKIQYKLRLCDLNKRGLQCVYFEGAKDIPCIKDFVGEENTFIDNWISPSYDSLYNPTLCIKGEKMVDGLSTRVPKNSYVVKIYGYIDPKTDTESFRCIIVPKLTFDLLFKTKQTLRCKCEVD